MYCIKCGVKLEDTEQKCPLCGTVVFHPELERPAVQPLYPAHKMPVARAGRKTLSGAVILVFLIPIIISLFSDLQLDGRLDWAGYVSGALVVGYIFVALPLWFRNRNPVIFVPCDFAAVALYLLYIDWATQGGWFFIFALPVTAGLAVIVCSLITLLRYIGRGKLYIHGGIWMAVGAWLLGVEYLLDATFHIAFIGWSVYPLIVFTMLGALLIYLGINRTAREMMERKLFF